MSRTAHLGTVLEFELAPETPTIADEPRQPAIGRRARVTLGALGVAAAIAGGLTVSVAPALPDELGPPAGIQPFDYRLCHLAEVAPPWSDLGARCALAPPGSPSGEVSARDASDAATPRSVPPGSGDYGTRESSEPAVQRMGSP